MANLRRSQLFVPGNDERKIKKAIEELADCDSIVFDLEDGVAQGSKDEARTTITRLLKEPPPMSFDHKKSTQDTKKSTNRKEICVRINPVDSPFSRADIQAVGKLEAVDVIVVPKAESSKELADIFRVTGKPMIPLIETARGLIEIVNIAQTENVLAIAYGAADLANSVGGTVLAYTANNYVKSSIAVTARAFGIDPIDNVFFDLSDMEGFRREATEARQLGFSGKQVIHPSQISVANEIFSPSEKEISDAKEIVEAYESAARMHGSGAIRLNNRLVDAVHYRHAKKLLESLKEEDKAQRAIDQ